MNGLDEKKTLHTFLLSLMGGASRWYYSLDPTNTKVWNELVELFVDQFIVNTMIDVTLRDLENTKQAIGETFSEYMTRWKGMAIEDAINSGQLEKGESKPLIKKTYGGGAATSKASNLVNNWVQVEEIDWNCSKLIETVEVNVVEVQEIWDEEDEMLKSAVAMWGILPKGMTELKKRVLEDNVANIIRSGKHCKPSFLEKDHLGRNMEEGSKPIEPKGKEEKEEEDRVMTQLKKT
ncbi:hypothetical protein SO802_006118 [Lithocarpus litseifolius]|uniref:Retrotransposon gag domain-containing protein n=1 Tax=Lithocarpus litseifolius TaxID=425828 RepID=A0AAW2DK06_9ROSI